MIPKNDTNTNKDIEVNEADAEQAKISEDIAITDFNVFSHCVAFVFYIFIIIMVTFVLNASGDKYLNAITMISKWGPLVGILLLIYDFFRLPILANKYPNEEFSSWVVQAVCYDIFRFVAFLVAHMICGISTLFIPQKPIIEISCYILCAIELITLICIWIYRTRR